MYAFRKEYYISLFYDAPTEDIRKKSGEEKMELSNSEELEKDKQELEQATDSDKLVEVSRL